MRTHQRGGVRQPEVTRRRIIEAAGELFSKRGFNGVGFRDIAKKAGVSLQMPTHHFATKKRLFAECIRYALLEHMDFSGQFADEPRFANAREARRALAEKIRICFFAVHPPSGKTSWYGAILGRALTENLGDGLRAFQDGLRPAREWFFAALKGLYPRLTRKDFVLWYASLWAQVSFHVTGRAAIVALLGKRRYDRTFLKAVSEQLVRMMLRQLDDRRS